MHSISRAAIAAFALILSADSAKADLIDQDTGVVNGNFNGTLHWQQEVTAGITGLLTRFTVYNFNPTTVTFRIANGGAISTGPFLFDQAVALNGGSGDYDPTTIDVSAAGIQVTAGQKFVIDLSGGTSVSFMGLARDTYAGGQLHRIYSGGVITYTQSIALQTFVEPAAATAVPEASSLALLCLTALVPVAVRRRRRAIQR